MDYSARWYSPSAGRFTTQDTWAGNPTSPQTLNRYAYALNNPVNITDPSGHRPCTSEDVCGWGDLGSGSFDNSGGDNSGGDTGGYGGDNGGGYSGGGGDTGGDGGLGGSGDGGGGSITPPSQPWWMDRQLREDNFYSAAGDQSPEVDNSPSYGQEFLSGAGNVVDIVLGISDTENAIHTLSDPNSGTWDRAGAVGRIFLNVGSDILLVTGVGEVVKGGYLAVKGGLYLAEAATTKEAEIIKPSPPPDPYASYGENGNLEGNFYDGAASSRNNDSQVTSQVEKLGGAYKNVPANGGQVHHMPADSVSPYSKGNGPAVRMDTADHMKTKSWGSSKQAKVYRAKQKELIEQGRFREAQQMDITDLKSQLLA